MNKDNKDLTKAAFIIWVLILFLEIIWFYIKIDLSIAFIVTVILITISVGALGLKMFGYTKEN